MMLEGGGGKKKKKKKEILPWQPYSAIAEKESTDSVKKPQKHLTYLLSIWVRD